MSDVFFLFMSHINSSCSTLSLSDVEKKCKQATSLKVPLTRAELNLQQVQELFQVRKATIHVYFFWQILQFRCRTKIESDLD